MRTVLARSITDHCSQVIDNTVRQGRVADPSETGPAEEGVRQLLKAIQEDVGVEATSLGVVGEKGYDGFTYALVL